MTADFHNDILTASGDILSLSQETDRCVCALFRGNRSFTALQKIAKRFFAEKSDNLYLGLEDIGYADEQNLEEICAWRPVYASLTWNSRNALAGGCMSGGHITKKGRIAVQRLSDYGIAIDCAHLGKDSFRDLLACEPRVLVDSHTCLNGVCSHPRNLDDWQVREILAHDGLIGIAFVGKFLCKRTPAKAWDVFRHIDYGVQKFGIDHFCLGSDFNGTDDLPQNLRRYSDLQRLSEIFLRAGYLSGDVEKVFAGNLQNFLEKSTKGHKC